MADTVQAVKMAVGADHGAVRLVAVAAMHHRPLADRTVGGDACIFRGFAEGVLDCFAELVQRIAVMPLRLSHRRKNQSQQTGSGGDAA